MEFLDTEFLRNEEILLLLNHTVDGDPSKNWVPAYHFDICNPSGDKMGTCDLRIGYNENIYYGGHIGYRIEPAFRGHHYAGKACEILFELAKKHGMEYLYITCNPDNLPSSMTLLYLNGELLEIVELPEDNDMCVDDGETEKCIFRFEL